MRFKLDENLGIRAQKFFRASAQEAHTVRDEGLGGSTDEDLYRLCCQEERCLITLDMDFADVTRFPPASSGGIVVIRVPNNPTLRLLELLIAQVLRMSETASVKGVLWIVEPGRIRVYQGDEAP